jgi:hypothetical protein
MSEAFETEVAATIDCEVAATIDSMALVIAVLP